MKNRCYIYLLLVLVFCCYSGLYSQHQKFSCPLDSPFVINGNYGELRPNHFHAGIDFSTNGKVNLPVRAVDDGYVSRIRVSPAGYGKCIYITHANGFVTVYAHLNSFSLEIDKLVKKKLTELGSYEVDFMPDPNTLQVKRGAVIALSGNSGGSSGPHLHFEIRDEKSEVPLNPLKFFQKEDRLKPMLMQFGFWDLTDTLSPKKIMTLVPRKTNDTARGSLGTLKIPQSIIGFAFSAIDRQHERGSINVVYSSKLFLDGKLIYHQDMNHIHFSEGRYVNEFCQQIGRVKFQKCFLPTIYPDGFYEYTFNKGRILLSDTLLHELRLVLMDEAGNRSISSMLIKATKFNFFKPFQPSTNYLRCDTDQVINENGISVVLPKFSMYKGAYVTIKNKMPVANTFSIYPADINLHMACQLSLPLPLELKNKSDKIVLCNGTNYNVGTVRNDSLVYLVKSFGAFKLAIDTVPPRASLLQLKGQSLWKNGSVSFKITDKLSGIKKFNLYLNENWVLADYDAKSDQVIYYVQADTPKGLLRFKLEVEDRCGNKSTLHQLVKR